MMIPRALRPRWLLGAVRPADANHHRPSLKRCTAGLSGFFVLIHGLAVRDAIGGWR